MKDGLPKTSRSPRRASTTMRAIAQAGRPLLPPLFAPVRLSVEPVAVGSVVAAGVAAAVAAGVAAGVAAAVGEGVGLAVGLGVGVAVSCNQNTLGCSQRLYKLFEGIMLY